MIEAKGITKQYGTLLAVDNVSFSIPKGEIVGLIGRNGAGKSTLLRMLTATLAPSAGSASVNGFDVGEKPRQVRRIIGYLPEIPPLYAEMTVHGFLRFVAKINGIPAGKRADAVEGALNKVNMSDRKAQLVGRLSQGYRKRLGIAQAIIHSPPVVILDEPTSGLDITQVTEFRHLMEGFKGEHTIILTSHHLREVLLLATRIMIIDHGKIVEDVAKSELVNQIGSGDDGSFENYVLQKMGSEVTK